jgi:hypothetical protein
MCRKKNAVDSKGDWKIVISGLRGDGGGISGPGPMHVNAQNKENFLAIP